MKIINIGDIHGSSEWEQIVHINHDADKFVFVGDYVDHWTKTNDEIRENLLNIIEFKKKNSDKAILLMGNHCLQYYFAYSSHGCSGFRAEVYFDLHDIYQQNKDLFQAAYQIDNYLWTHAGVSEGWAKRFGKEILADIINDEFIHGKSNSVIYEVGRSRGGWAQYGGPFWADRSETKSSYIEGLHQIVGHTKIDKITKFGDENRSIRYIDVLENKSLDLIDKYYELKI